MKKVFVAGLLAICLIGATQQQASAWVNARFGAAINWEWQTGGNSVCHGLWKNGQPPGPNYMSSAPFGAYPQYGAPQFSYSQVETPTYASTYTPPSMNYASPYTFAAYPQPAYYYSAPYYYGR